MVKQAACVLTIGMRERAPLRTFPCDKRKIPAVEGIEIEKEMKKHTKANAETEYKFHALPMLSCACDHACTMQ